MDKTGADFFKCLDDIVDRLGAKPVAIQLPIGSESNFKGLVDLVAHEGASSGTTKRSARSSTTSRFPADLNDRRKEYRDKLIEAAVELDDEVHATASSTAKSPTRRRSSGCIRKAVINGAFFPVLCGSAFKNKGVQPLLDAVVDYLPSPLDVPRDQGRRHKGDEVDAQAGRRRADVAARLQDHGRPVRRLAHLLPHLFGHADQRHRRAQLDQGPQGAHRPHAADACQQP